MIVNNLMIALGFTMIHYNSNHFHLNKKITAAQFSSFVGGISVAYILFHLIPSLLHYQTEIAELFNMTHIHSLHLIIMAAAAGAGIFFLLERRMQTAKLTMGLNESKNRSNVFWVHILSYSMYNFIVATFLANELFTTSLTAFFYLAVIGIHFITNDWVLRQHFQEQYDLYGRKIICAAIVTGYIFGTLAPTTSALAGLLEAFIAGSIILNAVKDELPHCKDTGLTPFLFGVVSYAAILIVVF